MVALPKILENLDVRRLVQEHLKLCDYKVCGYWDEQDKYYEIVTLLCILETELVSSSIGFTTMTERPNKIETILEQTAERAETIAKQENYK